MATRLGLYGGPRRARAVDTVVSANLEQLTLTTYAATVQAGQNVNVQCATEALTLTTYAASISYDVTVSANTEQLTLTTQAATISFDVTVSANTEALTLTTYPVSISAGNNISASVEQLTLTTLPATITYDVNILASVEALTLTTYPVSISAEEAQRGGGFIPRSAVFKGVRLRDQIFKDEELEEQILEAVEEAIDQAEQIESDNSDLDIRVPGQDIARMARRSLAQRETVIDTIRETERVGQKVALRQLEGRINELVRQRREFFESEQDDLYAILVILSEVA